MIDLIYRATRPVLFRVDPEAAHDRVLRALALLSRSPTALRLLGSNHDAPDPRLAVEIDGLRLPGPLGIAAGLDKNGVAFPALGALGWDFVEIGTITPLPQPGNPKPRVFRLPQDRALINRMGFPGEGADVIAAHLAQRRNDRVLIGCNIGPNKTSVASGLGAVIADCTLLARKFAPLSNYLVVNISSPNTARLRDLQGKEALRVLLTEVRAALPVKDKPPLFVKIAPDLAENEISDIVNVVLDTGISGIVATNTTTARPDSLVASTRNEPGGLSGAPLRDRSLQIIRQIARESNGSVPTIAVGGLFGAADVMDVIRAGATAVQIYTGLIYEGPGLARRIKHELLSAMNAAGVRSLEELRRIPA